MKHFYLSLFAGLLLITASCNSNKDPRRAFNSPVEYNDFIIESINKLDTAYMNSLDVEKGKEYCLKSCDSLIQLCDQYIENLKGIQPYEGDSTFSMQAIAYVQFMKNNGKNDIPQFLQLIDRYETAKT